MSTGGYTLNEEQLAEDEAIRKLSHLKYMGVSTWARKGYSPSVAWYVTHFGSWVNAWKEAGVAVPDKALKRSAVIMEKNGVKWTREVVLEKLREVGEEYGKITLRRWDELNKEPSSSTVKNVFGSWEEAWKEAGYKDHKDEIIREKAVEKIKELGTIISAKEWKTSHYTPSISPILRVFGSWNTFLIESGAVANEYDYIIRSRTIKLAPAKIATMVKKRAAGKSYLEIANEFGVSLQWAFHVVEKMKKLCELELVTGDPQVWDRRVKQSRRKIGKFNQRKFT